MRKLIGEKYVKKTYSGKDHYYIVEDQKALQALREYRQSKIVDVKVAENRYSRKCRKNK